MTRDYWPGAAALAAARRRRRKMKRGMSPYTTTGADIITMHKNALERVAATKIQRGFAGDAPSPGGIAARTSAEE